MAEGADDVGEDIEIGNENHAPQGTTLTLDAADGGFFADTAVLRVLPEVLGHGGANGIEVQGRGTGSAVVASCDEGVPTIVSSHLGGSFAIDATSSGGPDIAAVRGTNNAQFGIGVIGRSDEGTGVFGVSSSASGVVGNSSSGIGVFGECSPGSGVHGISQLGKGTVGESMSGIGVRAISLDGVAAFATSTHERAGVFLSGSVAPQAGPLIRTSGGGIAQVRLVPSADPKLPAKGSLGDLFVHLRTSAATPVAINLYLCVNDQPVQWQQVQLGATKFPGGQNAP